MEEGGGPLREGSARGEESVEWWPGAGSMEVKPLGEDEEGKGRGEIRMLSEQFRRKRRSSCRSFRKIGKVAKTWDVRLNGKNGKGTHTPPAATTLAASSFPSLELSQRILSTAISQVSATATDGSERYFRRMGKADSSEMAPRASAAYENQPSKNQESALKILFPKKPLFTGYRRERKGGRIEGREGRLKLTSCLTIGSWFKSSRTSESLGMARGLLS